MLAESQAWCCGGRQACDLRHGHGQVAAQPSTFDKWRFSQMEVRLYRWMVKKVVSSVHIVIYIYNQLLIITVYILICIYQ